MTTTIDSGAALAVSGLAARLHDIHCVVRSAGHVLDALIEACADADASDRVVDRRDALIEALRAMLEKAEAASAGEGEA